MSIIRLHIVTEGETEENFAKQILSPFLGAKQIFTYPSSILTSKNRRTGQQFKGGVSSYGKAKNDIQKYTKSDKSSECRVTTMFDYYGLPEDFPGMTESMKIKNPYERISFLEQAMENDIADHRFIPYIQIHEFEALVYSDLTKMGSVYIAKTEEIAQLERVVKEFNGNPELINNDRKTAPSKRILSLVPEYDKVQFGTKIVSAIGMEKLRASCRHFNEWITKLENLKS